MIILYKKYNNLKFCSITSGIGYKFTDLVAHIPNNLVSEVIKKIIKFNKKYNNIINTNNLIVLDNEINNIIDNFKNNLKPIIYYENSTSKLTDIKVISITSIISINIKNKIIVKNITENTIKKILNILLYDKLGDISGEINVNNIPFEYFNTIVNDNSAFLYRISMNNKAIDKSLMTTIKYLNLIDMQKRLTLLPDINVNEPNMMNMIIGTTIDLIKDKLNNLLNLKYTLEDNYGL